jgi:hypothetical protein
MTSDNLPGHVFIDESYGKNGDRGNFSVLVGSILKISSLEASNSIRDFHLSQKVFKTSRAAGNRRYGKIGRGLEWSNRCTAANYAVVSFHKRKIAEQMRQESLEVLLLALSKYPVRSITLDSRVNPDAPDPDQVDKKDLTIFKRMRSDGVFGRNVEISHKRDDDEWLLIIPDLIAWTTKSHIEGKFPELWSIASGFTEIISI